MAIHFSEEDQKKLREDTSEIYQKRTEETNREDVENLSGKGKWQYFKDYYLKTTVIAVIVICFLAVSLVQAFTRKPSNALYIAIQQDALDEKQVQAFEKAIEKYLDVDTKWEKVTVDTSCTDQQLQTYLYTGTADIVITGEENFYNWASAEYFMSTEKNKQVAFYKDYDEKYQYRTTYITGKDVLDNKETRKTEEGSDKTEYHCGLYLTDSEKYKQLGGFLDKPVLGLSNTTEQLGNAKKFVRYMMDNTQKMSLEQEKGEKTED